MTWAIARRSAGTRVRIGAGSRAARAAAGAAASGYAAGAATQMTQTSGRIPLAAPPMGLTTVIRQPVNVWPLAGGSWLAMLIAGRVFVRIVSSDSVSSPRPPPAIACWPAGQNAL